MGLDEQRMCQVDLPELLDVDRYASVTPLPSETFSGEPMPKQGIYRLQAVAMFKSYHYIAFIVVDGEWICFDGISDPPSAVARHPQDALNEGWVVAFVIYRKQPKLESLPNSGAEGHVLLRQASVPGTKTAKCEEIKDIATKYACPKATEASCSKSHLSQEAAATCGRLHKQITPPQDPSGAKEKRLEKLQAELEAQKSAQADQQAKLDAKEAALKQREKEIERHERHRREVEKQENHDAIARLDALITTLATEMSTLRERKDKLEERNRVLDQELGSMELEE